MEIRLVTMRDGDVVLNKKAKQGVAVDEICAVAESEVFGGNADYARVTVDGKTYAEYEA